MSSSHNVSVDSSREIIQLYRSKDDELNSALSNKFARENFKEWASKHQDFVDRSPKLSKILDRVAYMDMEGESLMWGLKTIKRIVYHVNFIYHQWWIKESVCDKIESHSLQTSESLDNSSLLLQYYKLGMYE